MSTTAYQLNTSLYLVHQLVVSNGAAAKPVETPTDHVFVLDCSGSMYGDIPRARDQLKRKTLKVMREGDTLSIIWFSGRGQCGVLMEGEPIATLADLKDVHAAIDRWLKPMGMTGFKEPLEEAVKLAGRLAKKNPGSSRSLFFMSDGCDNQWGRPEILSTVEKISTAFAGATFVEYGYYADRNLLASMAERSGGALIFAETFDKFTPSMEAALQKRPLGGKRIEVPIAGDPVNGLVFALDDGEVLTYAVEGGKISVPASLKEIFYLSPSKISSGKTESFDNADSRAPIKSAAYAAMSLFAVRMKPEVVFPILKALGDVAFIEQFGACFGKQKYSAFQDSTKAAAFDTTKRLTAGFDLNKVPRDDAFTVLDVLNLLSSDEGNSVLLESPDFKYSAIGRGRVDADETLTTEEQEEIAVLTAQLGTEKNVKVAKTIAEKIAAITNKPDALKFVADPAPDGYPISSLTFNEDRPNVSFLVNKPGTVDLSARLPEEFKGTGVGKIPPTFRTSIFRNYAVIKDGLVNVDKLPVRITMETYSKLVAEGVLSANFGGVVVSKLADNTSYVLATIDLKSLPVINRKMVKAASAKTLFEKVYEVTAARAAQKVYNSVKKEKAPAKTSVVYSALYGDAGCLWLKEQGITDGGFSPKSVVAPATDVYMGKELSVSMKGYSTLPSLDALRKSIAAKKLNGPATLMEPHLKAVDTFLSSDVYKNAANGEALFNTWIDGQCAEWKNKTRALLFEIAQIKFAVIVGQIWFTEFASIDENSMTLPVKGGSVDCKVEMKEIEVKI